MVPTGKPKSTPLCGRRMPVTGCFLEGLNCEVTLTRDLNGNLENDE